MPLTLITTPGSASANAYCDEAFADALAEELFPAPASWSFAESDTKRRAIVALTRRIDQERLVGDRLDSVQALGFPRTGVYDAAGLSTEPTTAIPDRVKRATALGAIALIRIWEAAGAGEQQALGPSDDAGISSISLGSELSLSFEPGASRETPFERYFSNEIRSILGTLVLAPQPRMVRG